MKESLQIGVGQTTFIEGGSITAIPQQKRRTLPGKTAIHETEHSVGAIKGGGSEVEYATIIPDADSLGTTKLSRFDPVAAAAPHGMGRSGTSYDMHVVTLMGVNPDSAARAGRSVIQQNGEVVAAVASELQEKGTLSGHEIKEIIRKVENKTQDVQIVFEFNGKRQVIEKQKAEKGFVVFRKEWLPHQILT